MEKEEKRRKNGIGNGKRVVISFHAMKIKEAFSLVLGIQAADGLSLIKAIKCNKMNAEK